MWVPNSKYKTMGRVLEGARKRAGLPQVQLAKALRKPQSFVSSYESGQRRLDVLELIRVANALDEKPERLFAAVVSQLK